MKNYEKPSITIEELFAEEAIAATADSPIPLLEEGGEVSIPAGDWGTYLAE